MLFHQWWLSLGLVILSPELIPSFLFRYFCIVVKHMVLISLVLAFSNLSREDIKDVHCNLQPGGSILGVRVLDPLAGLLVSGMIFKAGLESGYQRYNTHMISCYNAYDDKKE